MERSADCYEQYIGLEPPFVVAVVATSLATLRLKKLVLNGVRLRAGRIGLNRIRLD